MTVADLHLRAPGRHMSCAGFGPEAYAERGADAPRELRLVFRGFDQIDGEVFARNADGDDLFGGEIREFTAAIPCFTPDSLLATDRGLCAVQDLTPGMRVVTRDNGLQRVLWVGQRRFGWRALGLNPLLRPVRIAAGALGGGLPERDMLISPNHRFLTRLPNDGALGEGLSMARNLIGLDGVTSHACAEVDYVQILFERHELILADGCWSESFQPTHLTLPALAPEARAALLQTLPDPGAAGDAPLYAPVRPILDSPVSTPALVR
ncbi:MAG: Hint domain-containing protein [Paracoccaceae bacterium]|nr:Hint domain-containing protein [Paracoccaceae bacterium]